MLAPSTTHAFERYAWAGGIVFVAALAAESAISVAVKVDQNDSAAKIANAVADHHKRLIVIACLSIVYAVGFVIYLTRLHALLRDAVGRLSFVTSWILIGGVLFITLHGVSDIGITGMLGAKVATFSAANNQGIAYTLYLLTFALDSVGDVFGSLFALATGVLVIGGRVLPEWLGWVAILVCPLFLVQGFGLGGVISNFGLFLDLIGFLLFLVFVLVSSVMLLARPGVGAEAHA